MKALFVREALLFVILLGALLSTAISVSAVTQGKTTGRIEGAVTDDTGALIAGAEVSIVSKATGDERKVRTDGDGKYIVLSLAPGEYQVRVSASGFNASIDFVRVEIAETKTLDLRLKMAGVITDPFEVRVEPLIQKDDAQLGRVVDSRAVSESP